MLPSSHPFHCFALTDWLPCCLPNLLLVPLPYLQFRARLEPLGEMLAPSKSTAKVPLASKGHGFHPSAQLCL